MAYFFPAGGGGACKFDLAANSSKFLGTLLVLTTYLLNCNDNSFNVASIFPLSATMTAGAAFVSGPGPRGEGGATEDDAAGSWEAASAAGAGGCFLQPIATNAMITADRTKRLISPFTCRPAGGQAEGGLILVNSFNDAGRGGSAWYCGMEIIRPRRQ